MSSMQEQPRRNDQSRGEYDAPAADSVPDSAARSRGPGGGTSVVGQPTDPSSQPSPQGHAGSPAQDSRTGTAPFPPSAQMPGQQISAAQQPPSAADGSHPYVQTQDIPGGASKTPMDSIMQVVNKWGKKAEDMTGNVWGHLRTGPNVADTAFGRIAVITKSVAEGGMENVYRQAFDVAPDEHLLKSYACYLSTSTGPVAGTLYISTHKIAFCSDRPLVMPGSSTSPGKNQQDNQPSSDKTAAGAPQQQQQQQQQWVFYKLTVPLLQLQSVEPQENTQKKPPEKYILIKTIDGHDFWFMGFMNYDKGLKNLQEALASKQTSAAGNVDPAEAAAAGKNSEGSTESTKVGYTPATSKTAGTGTNTNGSLNAEPGNATASSIAYPDPAEKSTGPPPPYSSVNSSSS